LSKKGIKKTNEKRRTERGGGGVKKERKDEGPWSRERKRKTKKVSMQRK